MVLSLEQNVPSTHIVPSNFTTVGGFIDYTAVTASERDASRSVQRLFHTFMAQFYRGLHETPHSR